MFRKIKQIASHFPMSSFVIIVSTIISILILIPNYHYFPCADVVDFLLIAAHFLLSAMGILVIVTVLSLNRYVFAVLFPLFLLLSSIVAFFVWDIDMTVNAALVQAIFLTNTNEASAYITMGSVLTAVFSLALSIALVIFRFRVRWSKKDTLPVLAMAVFCALTFGIVNKVRLHTLSARAPFSIYMAATKFYHNEKAIRKDRIVLGKEAATNVDSLITVVVLGESLRADHLQMNGYHRVTMPKMEEKGVVSFSSIYSPYTYTAASLSYILTRSTPNNLKPKNTESSFISIFNSVGFHTAWLGNQNPVYTYAPFTYESDTVYINKPQFSVYSNSSRFDADLIQPFKEMINAPYSKQLIVVHLAGNHWWYNRNLPKEFEKYKPILKDRTISLENKQRMINSYDDVILSTDNVLNHFINELSDKNALLIFLSDHGESFGENGKWLHANGMPAEKNPAAFVWLSNKYQKKHPQWLKMLKSKRNKKINSAFLFSTVLAGSTIQSHYIIDSLNLFSPNCP